MTSTRGRSASGPSTEGEGRKVRSCTLSTYARDVEAAVTALELILISRKFATSHDWSKVGDREFRWPLSGRQHTSAGAPSHRAALLGRRAARPAAGPPSCPFRRCCEPPRWAVLTACAGVVAAASFVD